MHFAFTGNGKPAKNHVADFEVVFDEGPLLGLKLVGGALWSSRDGGDALHVTLPAQKVVQDGKQRYFDLLRSTGGDAETIREFKARVVSAFRSQRRSA